MTFTDFQKIQNFIITSLSQSIYEEEGEFMTPIKRGQCPSNKICPTFLGRHVFSDRNFGQAQNMFFLTAQQLPPPPPTPTLKNVPAPLHLGLLHQHPGYQMPTAAAAAYNDNQSPIFLQQHLALSHQLINCLGMFCS